jgi:hypothetical protein
LRYRFFFFEYYRLDADAFYPAFTLAIFISGCLAFCLNVNIPHYDQNHTLDVLLVTQSPFAMYFALSIR